MEAKDAAVSAHEEVVEERIENPDPDQLGQSGAIAEQRRYQEEGARGAAAAVNANGGKREKTLEERQFRIEIVQVPFFSSSHLLLILGFHRIEINPPLRAPVDEPSSRFRSRSSPRIAANKSQMYSSDDDGK